ncbi:acetyl-CoA synthetase-like protein [Cryphonectria parasitica EP155]|uniref:Acetyl-CoA synthetase-like protein n=1 Tax=Cryphonectria parasitica (strain ATCC 38755 / EP155) TaxID=660469 RepID=A0A9P4Y773_CRYP1|nr:acetyl-CoA synthetase-like protein [Cryphonectria parasitica EP155]KAF3767740.1 acetyl-CoA synthetase-like protein [Cryphonectria parasitica EP155]
MTTILPKFQAKPPFTVEVPGQKPVEGETPIRRIKAAIPDLVAKPQPDVSTVYELVKVSVEKFGNAKAMGSRKLIDVHQETKKVKKIIDGEECEVDKVWSYFQLGSYEYMTYLEYEKLILQVGAGLRKLGLNQGDRVHIFAATSSYWLAMSHGAASQSMPIVTAYDTLGEEGLRHSMVATEAKVIFLDPHLLPTLTNVLKDATEIRHVVWNSQNKIKQEHIDKLTAAYPNVKVLSFEDLRKSGEENPVDPVPPKPEDLCCIMYTSGSTGTPKGVPLKHSNVVASVAGVSVVVQPFIGPGDGLLTYLPLAHILEFVFENASLYWGSTMGYGNPKTLSDASVRHCNGDIREFKPSVLVGVPAVFETVKKGIIAKVEAGGPVVRNLFWGGMWAKSQLMGWGLPGSGILDAVVFKKVKEATGGRLKLCMNGGGPVAKDTQKFISMAIAPMIIGYGLTETTAMGTLGNPLEWTSESIGAPPAAVEAKLVDFPDAGYYATNKPHPQGEVWLRGPSIMDGYYQNDKETQEALTSDGWFKTGDIGEWDSNGHLKLIDRKKNLVKTLNGEYIALEKLESIYRSAPVVANICVYADDSQSKPVAIIVPAEPALKKLAEANGIKAGALEELVHNKKLHGLVLKELQSAGRAGGLAGIEIIDGVVLSDEEWTPQNGLVTAAQKLNRKGIVKKYKKQIDKAYGS